MNNLKELVLLSGGLDSTTMLYQRVHEVGSENVIALNMYYGQKHDKEMRYAEWTCRKLNVPYYSKDISEIFTFNPHVSALLKGSHTDIPHKTYQEQTEENKAAGGNGQVITYVPYRNGILLSLAAGTALQLGCTHVYYGAHADDAWENNYPDCTVNFLKAQRSAIIEGTSGAINVIAPWITMTKKDIVAQGIAVGMGKEEFAHTWSCYEGGEKPCGKCATCISRREALEANGIFEDK